VNKEEIESVRATLQAAEELAKREAARRRPMHLPFATRNQTSAVFRRVDLRQLPNYSFGCYLK
jgi:hypothetical protein